MAISIMILIALLFAIVLTSLFYHKKIAEWFKAHKKLGAALITIMVAAPTGALLYLGDQPSGPPVILDAKAYNYWYAPANSFGIESSKEVNVTFYRNWLNTTVIWSLQKSVDNIHWIDCTKLLVVDKIWNPVNLSEKHTLTWVADEDAYYQLLLKTDDVKTYQDLSNSKDAKSDRILLNYSITSTEDYNIYYDWSDYSKSAESSKTIMSKSVDVISSKQQFNWKVYTSQKLAKGEKFSIDPTFGYSTSAYSHYLRTGGNNKMLANYASPVSSGTVDNITMLFGSTSNSNTLQCALYNYVDYSSDYIGTLIATTETKAYTGSSDNKIFVFNFSAPKPTVTAGTNYYMVICGITDSGAASDYMRSETTGPGLGHGVMKSYSAGITWDSPITGEASDDFNYYLYCSYIVSAPSNTAPTVTSNSENPRNQSTAVGLSLTGNYSHFNITVADINDATQNMNITWKTNETTGTWHTFNTTTNVNNGTYYAYNRSWVDEYSKKYWWKVVVNDGTGGWDNHSYYFTTKAAPANNPPTIALISPANASTNIALNPSCRIWANDTDSTPLTAKWYTNKTGTWTLIKTYSANVTANGRTNYTFTNLNSYGTKYYWRVLLNDSSSNLDNHTFYFTTRPETSSTFSTPVPTNNSNTQALRSQCRITLTDAEGDSMTLRWYTNTTGVWILRQTNSSCANGTYRFTYSLATAYGTKYYWKVAANDTITNVSKWYCFTTAANVTPPSRKYWSETIRNNGIDYFVWLGSNCTAYNVSKQLTGFDEVAEYIAIWKNTTWNNSYGAWQRYFGDKTGINFTIHTFDVVEVYLTDAGTQTFNMLENITSGNYTNSKTYKLRNSTKNYGWNYSGYNRPLTVGTTLSAINTSIGIPANYYIALWNETNYTWNYWISGFWEVNKNVWQWNVIMTKINTTDTWVT